MEYKVGHNLNYTKTRRWIRLYNIHAQNHMFNSLRSRSVAGDTETGPKLLEDGSRQSLSHHISELLRRWHVENPNTAKGNLLVHEVNIELNMLRPSMVHRVGGEVDRADVIAVDKSGLVNITKQLLEQLTYPQEHSATALATASPPVMAARGCQPVPMITAAFTVPG